MALVLGSFKDEIEVIPLKLFKSSSQTLRWFGNDLAPELSKFFSESRSKCTAKASEEFSPINFKYSFPLANETMVLQLFTLCFQGIGSLQ